ncbi:SseB family protein [Actinomyces timonensis]|uniref:SseB family protein n=1 Tax=Actinomyces timonensis TaxID=1288391 RepID=UPI00031D2EE3
MNDVNDVNDSASAEGANAISTDGVAPDDPQLTAALAARAKMERLLAAPTPFASDTGEALPEVAAAIEATDLPRHEYIRGVVAALTATRVIVPVAAHALTGSAASHSVHTNDASRDAATLAVDLPDGHIALPVFTSAAAMSAWREDVRPVPVDPHRAAAVACEHTDQLWVLDPGTLDLRLPRPAVVALAGGEDWIPSWSSEAIQAEVRAQLQTVDGVTGVAFEPGETAELRVFIRVDASHGMPAVAAALDGCQRIMVNPAWGELIDTIELCPIPA